MAHPPSRNRAAAMAVLGALAASTFATACAHARDHTAARPPGTAQPATGQPATAQPATAPARAAARFPHNVTVGLGEQKPFVFADPRFHKLGITHMRYVLGWDSLGDRLQTRKLDSWMKAAKAAGIVPLISFDMSKRYGRHQKLPTTAQYAREFRTFHSRYPWVTEFAAWNEANLCGEPTCHHVDAVVGYYRAIRRACPTCKVLAAELLDVPGMEDWARQFVALAHVQPHYWGLHDYLGANRLTDDSTRQLARTVKGEIWLTETGGVVMRRNRSRYRGFPENPGHAALVTDYLLKHLVFVSPRIARVYLYEWNAASNHDSWDSALISYNGLTRPAYSVLLKALTATGTHLKG